MNNNNFSSWIEINSQNLKNNWRIIRTLIKPGVRIAPVIKSNAYGHGLVNAAIFFERLGASYLCVNSINEAKELRKSNVRCKILIVGLIFRFELEKVLDLDVEIFLDDMYIARCLNQLAFLRKRFAKIHLKVDTGMGRRGVLAKDAFDFLKELLKNKSLVVAGIATHFASSENIASSQFSLQLDSFRKLTQTVDDFYNINRLLKPLFHCANSGAIFRGTSTNFDLVRPGLALYGYYPNSQIANRTLQPALQWKCLVAEIKEVPAGYSIGYESIYITKHSSRLAIIPIGYALGLNPNLYNQWLMAFKNTLFPIRGKISMNMTTLDVSYCPEIKVGSELTVLGCQRNDLMSMAKALNNSPYEILASIKETIPRLWV